MPTVTGVKHYFVRVKYVHGLQVWNEVTLCGYCSAVGRQATGCLVICAVCRLISTKRFKEHETCKKQLFDRFQQFHRHLDNLCVAHVVHATTRHCVPAFCDYVISE